MQKIWSFSLDWDNVIPEDLICFGKTGMTKFLKCQNFLFLDITFLKYRMISWSIYNYIYFLMQVRKLFAHLHVTTLPKKTFKQFSSLLKHTSFFEIPYFHQAALCSARLSYSILKVLKLKIPCIYWTDSKVTYFGI